MPPEVGGWLNTHSITRYVTLLHWVVVLYSALLYTTWYSSPTLYAEELCLEHFTIVSHMRCWISWVFVALLCSGGVHSWDNDDLEIFDLVEEVNTNFYSLLGVEQNCALQSKLNELQDHLRVNYMRENISPSSDCLGSSHPIGLNDRNFQLLSNSEPFSYSALMNCTAAVCHHPSKQWAKVVPTFSGNSIEYPVLYIKRMEEYTKLFELTDQEILFCLSLSFKTTTSFWWEIENEHTHRIRVQGNLRARLHLEKYDPK
ncbi:hypothetical protein PR048_019073 [Dryococelus australis]|uniref:Uncharacterized protein n=1 Tax=Dryococelus australis TaxID=614101 RepID=A0ABQ9H2J6_9NEOP|nr:hypothetical protein PR048_019073 [Dryococelus australis]